MVTAQLKQCRATICVYCIFVIWLVHLKKKGKQTCFHKFNQQMEATDVNEDISFLAFIKKKGVYMYLRRSYHWPFEIGRVLSWVEFHLSETRYSSEQWLLNIATRKFICEKRHNEHKETERPYLVHYVTGMREIIGMREIPSYKSNNLFFKSPIGLFYICFRMYT